MRIFLSYSSHDRPVAESICYALRAQRHQVFFDRADLPAGDEYDGRIRRAIERSDLFLFLVSPHSLRDESYARTELAIAQRKYPHPGGRVLPVLLEAVSLDRLPAYLRSVTVLDPSGHVPAAVADAVHRLARERQRRVLARSAAGVAIAGVLVLAGYAYWTQGDAAVMTGRDGARALFVPAGPFTMGDDDEAPRRQVHVDAFYIDEHEVTVAQFARFLEATGVLNVGAAPGSGLRHAANLPMVEVDWVEADQYCRWAGRRLPTEAEWEKAARGTDGRRYPWGDDEPAPARARFGGSSSDDAYDGGLAPVGSHPDGRSPYGVHDLTGNAYEWVADWYSDTFAPSAVRNPRGPEDGSAKVLRGGGWYDPPERLQVTRRMFASRDTRADDIGFRCVVDAPQR